MPRFTGQVSHRYPSSAPLALRLPSEVYALDGLGADPYILPYPGGRLEVGPGGKLYETMGDSNPEGITKTLIMIGVLGAAYFIFTLGKKK